MENKSLLKFVLGALLLSVVVWFVYPVAEPEQEKLGNISLVNACRTATATSTFTLLEPGRGTTTLACSTGSSKLVKVNLIMQASSTNAVVRFRVERSMDNQDWFSDLVPVNEVATSTIFSAGFAENTIRFSTTTRQILYSTTTRNMVNFSLPVVGENFIRLTFYQDPIDVAAGFATTSGSYIWAQIVTTDETR